MSDIGGLLGLGGGAAGTGFSGPQGTDPEQIRKAYEQTQAGISQQQNFVNALNPGSIAALQSQQGLLGQLEQGAAGKGPNPALAQLAQSTAANTANQASLMAGQRGSSANTGLIARQAAQQGAANQQQAAGQAATLAAQQQLAQQQRLQAQQQAMVGQNQAGLNALNQYSSAQQQALLGMQGNINNINGNLASTTMGGQQNMLGGIMGGIGSAGGLMGSLGGMFGGGDYSGAWTNDYGAGNAISPSTVGEVMPATGGIGDAAGMLGAAKGGMVPKMADGGDVSTLMPVEQDPGVSKMNQITNPTGPQSSVGKMMAMQDAPLVHGKSGGGGGLPLGSMMGIAGKVGENIGMRHLIGEVGNYFGGMGSALGSFAGSTATMAGGAADVIAPAAEIAAPEVATAAPAVMLAASGGKVPALLSPGERYLSPDKVDKVAKGKGNPIKEGEKVPGKPKVSGAKNSYANDTVKAELEEGGIVLPRSVTMSKNPEQKAAEFVRAIMARKGLR